MRKVNKQEPLKEFEDFKANNKGANWSDFHKESPEVYQNTRFQILAEEQVFLCGYTEVLIDDDKDCHIDHYVKRNIDASKTFEWNNLIAACNDEDYGAKYKDNGYSIKKAEYLEIYNPVIDNPAEYINYLQNGEIEPKEDLKELDRKKVVKTVEVFNLNAKSLANRRATLIKMIRETKEGGLSQNDLKISFNTTGFESVKEQEI